MSDPREEQLEWYEKYGKYPERIIKDGNGKLYVIGDWSWNRIREEKPERIDSYMNSNFPPDKSCYAN